MSVVPITLILLAGLFIGTTGIGGVLVVPALTDAAGVAIDRAIAASMFGFLLTGIAAIALQRQSTEVRMRDFSLLGLAALLGAAGGAFIVEWLSAVYIRLFIAALAIVSGAHALAGRRAAQARPRNLSGPAYGCLGLLVGCGSALSGTGGPVILLPIL
ncbi:MAG: TSUP family transporter, partial [Dongiaceae bacterium]